MAILKRNGHFTANTILCVMLYVIAVGLMIWLIVKPITQNETSNHEIINYELETSSNMN